MIGEIFRTDHATVIHGMRKARADEILLLDMASRADELLEVLNRELPGRE